MRQQLVESAVEQRRQSLQHVTQVGPGIMPVHARRLHQAHHDGGTLPRKLAAHELPRTATHRPGLDLPFEVVIVERDSTVLKVPSQGRPMAQRVVDGLGRSAAVSDQPALQRQPLAQLFPQPTSAMNWAAIWCPTT